MPSSFAIITFVPGGQTGRYRDNQYFLSLPSPSMAALATGARVRFRSERGSLGARRESNELRLQKSATPNLHAYVDTHRAAVLHRPVWALVEADPSGKIATIDLLGFARSSNDKPVIDRGVEQVSGTGWDSGSGNSVLGERSTKTGYDAFAEEAATAHAVDAPVAEGRSRAWQQVLVRRGQGPFRDELMHLFNRRCFLSGCNVEDALEAAHIVPFSAGGLTAAANGLLLRSDLHVLFDVGLLALDPRRPQALAVILHPRLKASGHYSALATTPAIPAGIQRAAWLLNLARHMEWASIPT